MRILRRRIAGLGFAGLVLGLVFWTATGAVADDGEGVSGDDSEKAAAEGASPGPGGVSNDEFQPVREDWAPILYVPPSRGRGQALETAGGGTRGIARKEGLSVAVVAPPHLALTTREQPTLYWFVSAPTSARIDLTLVDDSLIDPLLEMTVPYPVERGIHTLDLRSLGIRLEPEKVYRWHVAVVHDSERRSSDLLAEGLIERSGMPPRLTRSLQEARHAYAPYAISGFWYDAMSELRSAIALDPEDRRLRLQEVALLEQAGLGEVARFARSSGH
jgi:hypothetical protein